MSTKSDFTQNRHVCDDWSPPYACTVLLPQQKYPVTRHHACIRSHETSQRTAYILRPSVPTAAWLSPTPMSANRVHTLLSGSYLQTKRRRCLIFFVLDSRSVFPVAKGGGSKTHLTSRCCAILKGGRGYNAWFIRTGSSPAGCYFCYLPRGIGSYGHGDRILGSRG